MDAKSVIEQSAEEAGRDPSVIGMEARVTWRGDMNDVVAKADAWTRAGATHISIDTMEAGLPDVAAHLEVLAKVFNRVCA